MLSVVTSPLFDLVFEDLEYCTQLVHRQLYVVAADVVGVQML